MVRIVMMMVGMLLALSANAQVWADSVRIGKRLYKEGKYKEAYHRFLTAQKLAPSHINLSKDIGNAAFRSENYEISEKAYSAAAEASDDIVERSLQLLNVGNSFMQAKEYKKAIESYKDALRENPANDKARYNLAMAQRLVKQQEKSKQQNSQNQQNAPEQHSQNSNTDVASMDSNKDNKPQNSTVGNNEHKKDDDSNVQGQLSDQRSENLLDELLKQEMRTRQRIERWESTKNPQQSKSGKRW